MENVPAIKESQPLTVKDIVDQVALIQDVMQKVMKDKEHYGVIPGCWDKPTLLKPGAEKLSLTFRMAPDYEIETVDMGRGHREFRIKCSLKYIPTGAFLGMGVGSASTMETKWRYRNADPEITEKQVPREYWDLKKSDSNKAQDMLGGRGFTTKKVNGVWMIAKLTGEKIEHDNPADYYNTCLKMAKKRALVDAVLTVTAASDIFTQDIEEMVENGVIDVKTEPADKQSSVPQVEEKKETPITEPQIKKINMELSRLKITDDWGRHNKVAELLGLEVVPASLKELTLDQASKVIKELVKEQPK
jgi:hypothetical protein